MTRERYLSQLAELSAAVERMGQEVIRTIRVSIEALETLDVSVAQDLLANEANVDSARHDIDEMAFLVIATQQPTAIDLRLVLATANVAGELERIGDYSAGIARLTLIMAGEPKGSPSPQIRRMADVTTGLLDKALGAFQERDVEAASAVWRRDDEVDDLYQDFFRSQIEEMVNHRKRVRRGTYMLWVAHNIERMADRVTNIAEAVAFVVTADVASWRGQLEAESVPAGH